MATTQGGWIKLSRKILDWRWYHNTNTLRVFLHLLLKANITDHDFETITIHRGELATSQGSLAKDLDLTIDQVRTALEHLKETEEITITRHSKFLVISIKNYSLYQDNPTQIPITSQSNPNQIPIKSQQSKNKKNDKEGEEYARERATPMESSESGWVTYRWEDLDDDDDDERTE